MDLAIQQFTKSRNSNHYNSETNEQVFFES